ncbi:hypothetical protein ACFL15_02155, partial [Patescibacteria group bacterium]
SNRYTILTAFELDNKKLKISPLTFINYLLIKPIYTFFNLFLRHKGFIDGLHGFVFDLFSAIHFPVAFFKYLDIKRDPKLKDVYTNWI